MPQTALPGLGLNYDFDAGTDGWKAGVDNNWTVLDALAIASVISELNAQPGGPGVGDAYIIGDSPSGAAWTGNAFALAVWNDISSAWSIIPPVEGFKVYDRNLGLYRVWDGTRWQVREGVVVQAANIIIDGSHYGAAIELDTSAAARDVTINPDATDDLPVGFHFYVINNSGANNVTFTLAGLTTRGIAAITTDRGALRIVKVAADTWISS